VSRGKRLQLRLWCCGPLPAQTSAMIEKLGKMRQDPKGRIGVPILLSLLGVPFGLVLVIWFFFFRG
jgi:hypothetical protein